VVHTKTEKHKDVVKALAALADIVAFAVLLCYISHEVQCILSWSIALPTKDD
jgi:hypothetical protein